MKTISKTYIGILLFSSALQTLYASERWQEVEQLDTGSGVWSEIPCAEGEG